MTRTTRNEERWIVAIDAAEGGRLDQLITLLRGNASLSADARMMLADLFQNGTFKLRSDSTPAEIRILSALGRRAGKDALNDLSTTGPESPLRATSAGPTKRYV